MKRLMVAAVCGFILSQLTVFGQGITSGQDPQLQANAANAAVQAKLSEPDGVAISIKPDGTFQIFARGSGECMFANPKAKRVARDNATKRAKANLSKFLKEKISSKESLVDVTTNSLSMSSDGTAQSQSASMESVEAATESIRNESEAILTGVIVLKDSYVPCGTGGEVQVTVGISSKTLEAAKKAAQGINKSLDGRDPSGATPQMPVPRPVVPVNNPEQRQAATDF